MVRTIAVIVVAAVMVLAAPLRAQTDLRVTPELERAVKRGLDHLAKTQNADGSWPGMNGQLSGVVGLAAMAFLAHGEVPDQGPYGPVIRKAIGYILARQQANGLLADNSGSVMYNHGFATLALAEAYGMIDEPRLGPALKKAVGLIVSSQNHLGGWRYSVNSTDADTTVSGAQMLALRAAANAGIEVPMETIQRAVAFYKRCFLAGGGFGYVGPDNPSTPRAGIGLLVLSLSGEHRSAEAKATADWLMNRPAGREGSYFYYGSYYCSQAMLQAGGKYLRAWNQAMTPAILALQDPGGGWSQNSGSEGPLCATAMALLSLEINYNYLPIYQR